MSISAQPRRDLPRYKCHKEVGALKIAAILCRGSIVLGSACGSCERCKDGPGIGATIIPIDPAIPPFNVSAEFIAKHKPEPGGYFVEYEDGYQSFSPAKAFEEGYTRI